MQQEALQRHRVLLGQEEGGLREVMARREHLPGALQVEQDAGPAGEVHVPVVLQKSVVEQTVIPEADGLKHRRREGDNSATVKDIFTVCSFSINTCINMNPISKFTRKRDSTACVKG